MTINKRKLFRSIKIFIIVYCLIGIALYYLQDNFLFHPKALSRDHVFKFDGKFEELNIPMNKEDTVNIIKFFPAQKPHRGVVIYFHGNMENVERYAPFVSVFTKKGYEVWMPDYPGYGKSTGELTEDKLYDQAMQVHKLAMMKYHSDSIILYGKSLGSGIAAYVASESPAKKLILETPYSSIPDVFGCYAFIFPVQRMIRFKIPEKEFLQDTKMPVTIFAGSSDWIIPMRCASKLKKVLKPSDKFIEVEGAGHNDVNKTQQYFKEMDELLK